MQKKMASNTLKKNGQTWSHDVFSLGMTVIEILMCVPLWMVNNQRVEVYPGKVRVMGAVFPSIKRKIDSVS